MSYTLSVEPDVIRSAESCASRQGTTLDALIRAYLAAFVRRQNEGERLAMELDEFISEMPVSKGEAYSFCREDAYDEELS